MFKVGVGGDIDLYKRILKKRRIYVFVFLYGKIKGRRKLYNVILVVY